MPNIGTWKAPLPLRLGGKADSLVDMFYQILRANRPTMLRGGEDTQIEAENKADARMLACGWRATQRRLTQRDPLKLSALLRPVTLPGESTPQLRSVLGRWEGLLGLRPTPVQTDRSRREAVAAKLLASSANTQRVVREAMETLFGSWLLGISEHRAADVDYPGRPTPGEVHAEWGDEAFVHSADYPGEYSETWFWRSAVCEITVNLQPPAATAQREVDERVGRASSLLDDLLPAWMDFHFSQLPAEQTELGFFAGVSLVGYTAVL